LKSFFLFKKAVIVLFSIFLLILISGKTFAQKQIKGIVHNEMEQPLPFANVILLNISDSSIMSHTATDDLGAFQFDLKTNQNPFLIAINYIGYEPLKQNLDNEQQSNSPLNLGVLRLTPLSKLLSEAVITATREPVQIKGDTMPVNSPSAAQLSAHTALGFRMWRNRLRFNWTTNNSYNTAISFINSEENTVYRLNAASSLRAELNIPDTFELSFKASVKYNQTDYSLQTNLSQWYVAYDYEVEMSVTLLYNTRLRSNFDYSIQMGKAFGTTPGIPIWGLSFSKFLDDNRRNEIRLMVVDALNRNTGINRFADGNYVQEERIRSLGRYGMLSFTYFFSDKSGKKVAKVSK
jgi:Outer membrane protein beta-barrel family